jgi:hypothetical protein
MTLAPESLEPADADAARDAGVSEQALIDAIHVCALFSMIVRMADSLGWDVPPAEALAARAPFLLENGYRLVTAEQLRSASLPGSPQPSAAGQPSRP